MLQLKNLRKSNGITQIQLAEYMGITQATLSGWENEKFEIDTSSLKKLANYFDVTIDYLLVLEGRLKEKSPSDDEELENVISYHRDGKTVRKQLTKKQLEAIHNLIETMKESDEDL